MKNWKRLLTDNLGLKLISVTLAFALWFVVISIDDPVDEKSFNNIKVNFINTEELTNNNKVYEVLDATDVVRRITFEAPDSVRKEIDASDFVAEADFANITAAETVEINFSCPKYSSQVTNITGNISFVKLDVEDKASKWIDIKYNLIGDVADGYMINSNGTVLDQNRLQIEGPASKVEEVSKAYVDINVEGVSNNIVTRADIYLVDKEGNVLDYSAIKKNAENIKVTVDILAIKEVPIAFSLDDEMIEGYMVTGEPAEGYAATGVIEISPASVMIAGNSGAVNALSSIVVPAEDIDISDHKQTFEIDINLRKYLPNGITFAEKKFDGKMHVTVYIGEILEDEIELNSKNLSIINVPSGLIGVYPKEATAPKLIVQGLEEELAQINSVRGIIDVTAWMAEQGMTEMSAGIYEIPAVFTLPDGVEQMEDVKVSIEFVTPETYMLRVNADETAD